MSSKQTRKPTRIAAEICLYGTSRIGFGFLATTTGVTIIGGDGEPKAGRSMTETIWTALDEVRSHGHRDGVLRIYEPNGRHADFDLADGHVPPAGDIRWSEQAITYELSVDSIKDASATK